MCFFMLLLCLSFYSYFSENMSSLTSLSATHSCPGVCFVSLGESAKSPQNYGALLSQTKKRSAFLPTWRRETCHQLSLQTVQSGRKTWNNPVIWLPGVDPPIFWKGRTEIEDEPLKGTQLVGICVCVGRIFFF